jgi:hypothetical protein
MLIDVDWDHTIRQCEACGIRPHLRIWWDSELNTTYMYLRCPSCRKTTSSSDNPDIVVEDWDQLNPGGRYI